MPEALEDVPVTDPDPDPPPARLAALVSDPRDVPPAGSAETLEVASTDPAAWRAHWAEHGKRHDPRQRVRRGNGYSPSVSLYELDRLPLSTEDRRRLHRELCARTGKITAFDPHDFVLAQEQSLAAWGALVKAAAETPGSWARAMGALRRRRSELPAHDAALLRLPSLRGLGQSPAPPGGAPSSTGVWGQSPAPCRAELYRQPGFWGRARAPRRAEPHRQPGFKGRARLLPGGALHRRPRCHGMALSMRDGPSCPIRT